MRIMHGYRNISRASKQFLMGDKILEQLMILTLKNYFFHPMTFKSPIQNTFFLERTLADLVDRHYALFANNQHPIQLSVYDEYNKFLRLQSSEAAQARKTEFEENLQIAIDDKKKQLNVAEGESISFDELEDIYIQVRAAERQKNNFSLTTKGRTGEI